MTADPSSTDRQATCSSCGASFSRIYVSLCNECMKDDDKRFALIRDYLRTHAGATINDISEATGLSRGDVARFESSGRLMRVSGGFTMQQEHCTCTGSGPRCEYCRKQLASRVIGDYAARGESLPPKPGQEQPTEGQRVFYTRRARRLEEE